MMSLPLAQPGQRLSVLCLGAHPDDIEIGVGGTLLSWIAQGVQLEVDWCVFSATSRRAHEAEASAAAFLTGAVGRHLRLAEFPDSRFPSHSDAIKDWLLAVREQVSPQVIFTHQRLDAHQDHRTVCELTWNLFRDHLIFEYEIPKWDGDFGQPNYFMPLSDHILVRKIDLLMTHFGTQRSKDWFQPETFRALARLRGLECRAADQWAEGFFARKVRLA
jgi:LmbE family N-acetylglucosaminyl deacetylase